MPIKTPIYRFLVPASGSRFLYSDELPGNAVDPAIIGFSGEATFIEEVISNFTPADLASLRLWMDERGITGPPVSQWDDQANVVGDSAYFEQTVGANQPGTSTINGITVIDFDESTFNWMQGRKLAGPTNMILSDILSASSYHAFAVVSVRSVNSGYTTTLGYHLPTVVQDNGGYWYPFSFRYIDPTTVEVRGGHWTGTDVTISAGNLPALNQPVLLEVSYNGDVLSLQVNNNAAGTTSGVASVSVLNNRVDLGRPYSLSRYLDGLVGDIIVCNSVLSAGDRTAVRDYLIDKYSITV